MDWPVAASNVFICVAVGGLLCAPLAGIAGGWRALPFVISATISATLLASFVLLAFSWRGIPGGIRFAALGHFALLVSIAALAEVGRVARALFADRLAAALAGLCVTVILVAGIFALAPVTQHVSVALSYWLLLANPLIAVTSAAGIDLLHLDTIYRTSPLAHRGVVLPAWTTACAVYAFAGVAAFGASRIPLRSPQR